MGVQSFLAKLNHAVVMLRYIKPLLASIKPVQGLLLLPVLLLKCTIRISIAIGWACRVVVVGFEGVSQSCELRANRISLPL